MGCTYFRRANNVVKKNTEFRFFQWSLSLLGVCEGQSGLDVVVKAKVDTIHKCLCILLEFDVVEVSSIWSNRSCDPLSYHPDIAIL